MLYNVFPLRLSTPAIVLLLLKFLLYSQERNVPLANKKPYMPICLHACFFSLTHTPLWPADTKTMIKDAHMQRQKCKSRGRQREYRDSFPRFAYHGGCGGHDAC